MKCHDIQRLLAARAVLSSSEEQAVRTHLLTCAACHAAWQREAHTTRVLQSLPVSAARPSAEVLRRIEYRLYRTPVPWWRSSRVALVGVVLGVLVLGGMLSGDRVGTRVPAVSTTPPPPSVAMDILPSSASTPAPQLAASATASPSVTIRFAASEQERAYYESLIPAFNQQQPNIQVEFVAVDVGATNGPRDGRTPVQQMLHVADTAAPLMVQAEDVANGSLRDLKPFMDADPAFNQDDFFTAALDAARVQNGIYMVPHTLNLPLLRYNKDLWTARGLPQPSADWTWDAFVRAAEQVAQHDDPTSAVYGFMGYDSAGQVLMGELAARGMNLCALDANDIRFDDPRVVTAVERVAAFTAAGGLVLNAHSGGPALDYEYLLVEQHVGMWDIGLLSRNAFSEHVFTEQSVFPLGVVPYPALPLPFFGASVQSYVMSDATEHPDAAWRWLMFLSTQPQAPMSSQNSTQLPARQSIAARRQPNVETSAAVEALLARPVAPLPRSGCSAQVLAPLYSALNAVLRGEQAPSSALAAAQQARSQALPSAP